MVGWRELLMSVDSRGVMSISDNLVVLISRLLTKGKSICRAEVRCRKHLFKVLIGYVIWFLLTIRHSML